jgi:hypothetical protein
MFFFFYWASYLGVLSVFGADLAGSGDVRIGTKDKDTAKLAQPEGFTCIPGYCQFQGTFYADPVIKARYFELPVQSTPTAKADSVILWLNEDVDGSSWSIRGIFPNGTVKVLTTN